MADEIVKIIRIESDGAEQTVASLVNEIKNLTEAMNGVTKGTEEYTNILKQLSENQEKLGKAMKTNKQEVTAAEGSYNALVKQMAALKKQWRETTDEASRKELGNQIKDINGKLKNMDASIGNFQRNVGNYADGVKTAFGSMSGAAKGMVGPLNSVKQGFNALAAHPLVAVLTTLAALLINGIAKGFKSSEENTNKLREAFSGFQAIGDAVTKMFQTLAGWIGNVANAAVNLADKLGLLGPKFKERQEMTRKQIALEKQERDAILQKANLETEAAELRAKASDEENYSISQRIEFLQQAQAKEQEQLELEKQILEQKVTQLEAQLALTDSTGEELTKLNELKAQVVKINGQIAASQRSTNKEITALRRRGLSEAQQANQARLNLEKDLLKQELELTEKGTEEQLRLQKELRKKELEIQLEGLRAKIKNVKDYNTAAELATKKYNQDVATLDRTFQQEQNDRVVTHMRNMAATLKDGSSEYYEALANAEREAYRKAQELGKNPDETEDEFNDRLRAFNNNIRKFQDSALQARETEVRLTNQIILEGTRPMSLYYAKQREQLQEELDNMVKYSTETEEEFVARQKALQKQIDDLFANQMDAAIAERKRRFEAFQEFDNDRAGRTIFENLKAEVNLAKLEYEIATEDMFDFIKDKTQEIADATGMLPSEIVKGYKEGLEKIKQGEDPFGSEAFKEMFSQLYAVGIMPESVIDKFLYGPKTIKEKTIEYNEEIKQSYMDLAGNIGKMFSSIGDIYAINLENRKKKLEKEGKYNEQERKNLEQQYKTVQAIKIAEATINTINGALAALTSPTYQSMGAIGAALAAVQAAAVTAAGIAEIMKIKQTNPYSDSSSSLSSGGMMSATVQPTVSDYQPEYTSNLTGRSDTEYLNEALGKTRLVVSVSEINEVQNRVRVVESESQF